MKVAATELAQTVVHRAPVRIFDVVAVVKTHEGDTKRHEAQTMRDNMNKWCNNAINHSLCNEAA